MDNPRFYHELTGHAASAFGTGLLITGDAQLMGSCGPAGRANTFSSRPQSSSASAAAAAALTSSLSASSSGSSALHGNLLFNVFSANRIFYDGITGSSHKYRKIPRDNPEWRIYIFF